MRERERHKHTLTWPVLSTNDCVIGLSGLLAAPQLQLTREAITCKRSSWGQREVGGGRDLPRKTKASGRRAAEARGAQGAQRGGCFSAACVVTDRLHGIHVSGNSGRRERNGGEGCGGGARMVSEEGDGMRSDRRASQTLLASW